MFYEFELEKEKQTYLQLKNSHLVFFCTWQNGHYRIDYPYGFLDYHGQKHHILKGDIALVLSHSDQQKLILLLNEKKFQFQRYSLEQMTKVQIGRAATCALVYLSNVISMYHCELHKVENDWYISDLKSANGIYVNGLRAWHQHLTRGDRLDIANHPFWFMGDHLLCPTPYHSQLSVFCPLLSTRIEENLYYLENPKVPLRPVISTSQSYQLQETAIPYIRLSLLELISPLLYPCFMFFSSYQQMGKIFLWAAICMAGLRILDHRMKKHRAKKQMNLERYRHDIYTWLLESFDMVIKETCFPDLETMHDDYQEMLDFLAWSKDDPRFGSIALALGVGLCLADYDSIQVVLADQEQLDFLLYQLMVYHHPTNLSIAFCLDRDYRYRLMRWIPHAYHHEQLLVSWQSAHDQEIIGQIQNRYLMIFSCRPLPFDISNSTVFYLKSAKGPVDAVLDFKRGLFSDLKKQKQIPFVVGRMPPAQWFYEYFKNHLPFLSDLKAVFKFTDLFKDGIDVAANWRKMDPHFHLQAPIGLTQDGELIEIDLHETYDGPHLLVAGMTGSGKSVWLSQLVMALSIRYAPSHLQFFLIDFKGGGLSNRFENLPHVSMTLTNLQEDQMWRALYALEDELNDRERLLLEIAQKVGEPVSDLMSLERLKRNGRTTQQIPHLFIVIDEFAELKLLYPEILKQLIRLARVGRSLGIHLIMATQQPSGIIDGQILANLKSRILFRVASRQESMEIIGYPDAASIKEAGLFYFLSGNGHLVQAKSCLLDSSQSRWIKVGNCCAMDEKKEFQLLVNQQDSASNLEQILFTKMRNLSKQVPRLYENQFPPNPTPLPNNTIEHFLLGYIDDFYHRAFPYYEVDFHSGLLIVANSPNVLENFFSLLPIDTVVIGDLHLSSLQTVNLEASHLKAYLSSLEKECIVVFYAMTSSLDQYPEIYQWLANQKRFGYCFIENTASFLRMRLLQLCQYRLCFIKGQEPYLLEKSTSLSLGDSLEMFLRANNQIYKGRLFEAKGCYLFDQSPNKAICLGKCQDRPYYTCRNIVLEDEQGIYQAYLESQKSMHIFVQHYPFETQKSPWVYCVTHRLVRFLEEKRLCQDALYLYVDKRQVMVDGQWTLEF